MRPDVKLGMIVSLVVVFVAGGYYIYRDAQEKPIPLSGGNVVATTPQTQHDPPTAPPAHERSKTAAPQEKKDRAARIAERRTKTEAGKSSETPKVDGAEQRTRRSADGKQKNTRRKPRRGPSKQAKSAQQTREKGTQTTGKQQEDKGTAKPTQQAPRRRARVTEKKSGNVERPTQGGGQQPRTQTARRKMTGRDAPVESGSQRADFPGTRNQSVALVSTSKERTDARNVALDTHRVQSGDTFASLALSYYGSEKHTQFLIDSNPHVGDPRRLAIDTKIKIPPLPPPLRVWQQGAAQLGPKALTRSQPDGGPTQSNPVTVSTR
ncbi:MAG: LysM peptidoglycan-binding domain-containing protein [Phycisphaerales bacterium]|nr:MAG: LysM peptidoglycan-binding domain-containing protein [Phycisphaerales bacterium]